MLSDEDIGVEQYHDTIRRSSSDRAKRRTMKEVKLQDQQRRHRDKEAERRSSRDDRRHSRERRGSRERRSSRESTRSRRSSRDHPPSSIHRRSSKDGPERHERRRSSRPKSLEGLTEFLSQEDEDDEEVTIRSAVSAPNIPTLESTDSSSPDEVFRALLPPDIMGIV